MSDALHVIAVKHDTMEKRHSVLGFQGATPISNHCGGILDLGHDLCAAGVHGLFRDFDDLRRADENCIEVDELRPSNDLSHAVLHFGNATATANL